MAQAATLDRKAKRARCSTVHTFGLSQHALSKAANALNELDSAPSAYSGWKLRNAADIKRVAKEMHAKQISLPGVEFQWHVPGLHGLLQWHASNNKILQLHLGEMLKGRPQAAIAEPLHLVNYCDEFTPGNVLAPLTERKCNNWYVSFLELKDALSVQHVWMHAASLLTSKIDMLDCGVSTAHRWLLESWIDETPSLVHGCCIEMRGEVYFIKVVLDPAVFDEKAMKEV